MAEPLAERWDPPVLAPHLRVMPQARRAAVLRAAIVDDNLAGRERLRRRLDATLDIEVVGAGTDCDDAIALARSTCPDLLFVAVRGAAGNPLDSVAALPHDCRPAIVVIADREGYAFKAFEIEALDYLLEPFTDARFERCLGRARRLLGGSGATPPAIATARPLPAAKRLIVKTPGQLTFLPLAEVDWVESAGNYVRVHAGRECHMARESMKRVEARLDQRFVRVHRGAIVNADRIRRISNDAAGHLWVVLKDGTEIAAGRYIEEKLREWVNCAC